MAKRKPKFKVGDRVRCVKGCRATIITEVLWVPGLNLFVYRLGKERFTKEFGGHTSTELRRVNKRERGEG